MLTSSRVLISPTLTVHCQELVLTWWLSLTGKVVAGVGGVEEVGGVSGLAAAAVAVYYRAASAGLVASRGLARSEGGGSTGGGAGVGVLLLLLLLLLILLLLLLVLLLL